MSADPIDDLLDQLARGDVEAAGALFAAYAPYLRALVRRQVSDQLRAKFDSADVVQSVWVQVVRQLGRDGWSIEDEARLRGLLATIARRRLLTRVRKHANDLAPDQPREAEVETVPEHRFPRPSEVAQADDMWERMLEICPREHHPVLVLKREGLPLTEIASRTGLHEGSVRRILRRLARELALRQVPLPTDEPMAETTG
jgi:RNA polymerase sigma-70 factor (ECF subfamily)